MKLVDYSDSEESDTEAGPAPPPAKPAPAPSTKSDKPAFQKVVDRSNPHKIRVNLPSASAFADEDKVEDGPPAKKARTGGGAFSGINAFLPAPKKKAPPAGGLGGGKSASRPILGNLKTGTAPAFSREPIVAEDSYGAAEEEVEKPAGQSGADGQSQAAVTDSQKDSSAEIKLTGNRFKFKPLSVVNRNAPKKKKKKPTQSVPVPAAAATTTVEEQKRPAKPKVSLFSLPSEDHSEAVSSEAKSNGYYKPLLDEAEEDEEPLDGLATGDPTFAHYQEYGANYTTTPGASAPAAASQNPRSLEAIASDLNLSAAEKRQLFGRAGKGIPDMSSINVVNFNTDQEYAANEALRATGETLQHNPVRGIAPGKHSLKQLVNAASTQKDALEEHFATGRRNKKEAGSKYGW